LQVPPEQHPSGQVVASHVVPQTPAAHVSVHASQGPPATPQTASSVPGWQTPDASQQPAQLTASQAQAPVTHC
jgi:hypothetical protein